MLPGKKLKGQDEDAVRHLDVAPAEADDDAALAGADSTLADADSPPIAADAQLAGGPSSNGDHAGDEGAPGVTPPSHPRGTSAHVMDLLVELGYATPEQVQEAVEEARATSAISPQRVLLDRFIISPDDIARALAERFGLDFLDLNVFRINPAAANLISAEVARRYRAVPVDFADDHTLLVVMSDPTNVLAIDDLAIMTGYEIQPAVASAGDIESAIGQLSKLDTTIEEAIEAVEEDAGEAEIADIRESAEDAPTIKLTHAIIAKALDQRASDIHLEPETDEMTVRYRIDGVLVNATTVPRRMIPGVISRIKVIADLDIAERRLPQDGRVTIKVEGRPIDIRVVSLPSTNGESIVMRLLDTEQAVIALNDLGLRGESLAFFERAIHKPYGATLVTGPTGSGKTTTLYAGLQLINSPEKGILTVEDPVEYQIGGVTQLQVHPKAGLTFSTGLRSMLRADPDVIMVGEVRDRETAKIAMEAALTGHLVLTTLHTNNAPAAVTRLTDMGIEPFLIASAVDCVVAQRLARRLCDSCRRQIQLTPEALRASGFTVADGETVAGYEPGGCQRCNATGYRGRIGVFEVMRVSEEVRKLILSKASVDEIRALAVGEGMRTLRDDGLDKIRQGVTSAEEVSRVIS